MAGDVIIARIRGGLGNQMFQYATAKALASRLGCPFRVHVPIVRRRDRPFELHRFAADVRVARLEDFRPFTGGVMSWPFLRRRRHPQVRLERGHNFNGSLLQSPAPMYLEGYWQCERYFAAHRDELLADFGLRAPQSRANAQTLAEIEAAPSIAVHVRRTDYVAAQGEHAVLSVSYYVDAMRHMSATVRDAVFFVFSDDMKWAREHLASLGRCVFVDRNAREPWEDLRLIRACKHQIIANSSFSWWGAWLNTHPRKVVVAPRNWLAKPSHMFEDIYPIDWIRM